MICPYCNRDLDMNRKAFFLHFWLRSRDVERRTLAEAMGVSVDALFKWYRWAKGEEGGSRPSDRSMKKIERFME